MSSASTSTRHLARPGIDTFERLQAGEVDVVRKPTDQPSGVRDCAFRDPAGTMIRIFEVS